ncbi:MAG: acyl-ACP--UDP-N-acetylglucosamine O-acyltransferase [Chitinophagaceae bacterium]|nr:acyl-ACP--UDP-N-acetylglucosamine O-acyltransferase [Chitinophagaceae bacterium]
MISPLAHIHPDAKIGKNVRVDPFAMIEGIVKIGDGTHIMSGAVIMDHTTIGRNCKVFPHAVIGAIPQDLKFDGELTTVEIGDNTTVRECVTIHRGTREKWKTTIGSNCLLMAYCHIAHDCVIGNNVIIANGVQLAGHVEIGDYAGIGGLAVAIQFSHIGTHAYISGNSEIVKDVPPFIKVGRKPLSYEGINAVGLQRRGYSSERITNIQEIYRIVYLKGLNVSQATARIEREIPNSDEKAEILSFIKTSKRGIVKHSFHEACEEKPQIISK